MTPASGAAATIALTTTAAVPSGGKIILAFAWYHASNVLSSVGDNGPGLDYRIDQQGQQANDHLAIVSADAPSGMSSGVVITAQITSGSSRYAQGCYVTGAQTGDVDYAGAGANGTTAAAWSAGPVTVTNGDILMSACYLEAPSSTLGNTPSGGNSEVTGADQGIAADSELVFCYQAGTGASISGSGTWASAGTEWRAAVVAYPAITITYQQFRPDADTDADSWTTTPLWSKVNEVSADGTVITATAS